MDIIVLGGASACNQVSQEETPHLEERPSQELAQRLPHVFESEVNVGAAPTLPPVVLDYADRYISPPPTVSCAATASSP